MAKAKTEETFGEAFDDDVSGASFENQEDGLVVNLSEVEELKFENLPKGKYNVIVEDNQFSMSKSSNKPMWNLKLNVVDGEYAGRKLFEILSWSEKALSGTKTRLAIIAPELLEGNVKVNDPEVVASLIGRQFRVQVDIGKGTDEYPDPRNVIKRWFAPEGEAAFG